MRALFAKFVTTLVGAGLMMSATAALACNTGCPSTPPTPPPSSCGCDTGGNGGGNGGHHHGHGGGNNNSDVNVNVNVQTTTESDTSANARTAVANWNAGFAATGAATSGTGYSNWAESAGTPQNAGALNVETGAAAFDMITDRRTVTRTLVLQASCIDDTGVPHPASQVSAERAIANEYMGEVYRCIAGTHMQVTMADFGICDDFGGAAGETRVSESESSSYSHSESHSASGYDSGYQGGQGYQGQGYQGQGGPDAGPCSPQALACSASGGYAAQGASYQGGESHEVAMGGARRAGCAANTMDLTHVNFDGGKTMTCQKGDALWFDHGNLTCKAQILQRQCNERSLLRRFGVGLKVLTVTRVETMQRQVARQVERTSSASMTFDGGVGGFVE